MELLDECSCFVLKNLRRFMCHFSERGVISLSLFFIVIMCRGILSKMLLKTQRFLVLFEDTLYAILKSGNV